MMKQIYIVAIFFICTGLVQAGRRMDFHADFTASPTGGISVASLDAGTPVGSWAVSNAVTSFIDSGFLAGDFGLYNLFAEVATGARLDGEVVVTIPFRQKRSGTTKWNRVRLYDENDNRLVTVRYTGNLDTSDVQIFSGAWLSLSTNAIQPATMDALPASLDEMRIVLRGGRYALYINDLLLTNDVPLAASGAFVKTINLDGVTTTSGAWYDSIRIESQDYFGPTEETSMLDNPRFRLADGCVTRYNGGYFAMGIAPSLAGINIKGKIYSSLDLYNWADPLKAFNPAPTWDAPTDYYVVGAGDILYRNGIFHIYWNGIAHAYATNAMGMYQDHPVDALFDQGLGIDPQLFQDDDGGLVYVRKRNPGDPDPVTGGTSASTLPEVWLWDFSTPWVKSGTPYFALAGQKGTWDQWDKTNFEGPELFKHRDLYYLLYVANCMDPRTGLYDTGVAVGSSPFAITNSDKYPHPVLHRNVEQLFKQSKAILDTSEKVPWDGRWTTTAPPSNWKDSAFDDSAWTLGAGGFGYPDETRNTLIRACRTIWNSPDIWVRRTFVPDESPARLMLKIRHETDAQVYLNGTLVYDGSGPFWAYRNIDVSAYASLLSAGENTLAVHASYTDGKDFHFLDFGLYDTGGWPVESVVYGPSQPNFVEGPNGFEKWIMYKAFWNGVPDQGIDRLFFFNNELYVDGPTTTNTPGYHPLPSLPTAQSGFVQLAGPARQWVDSVPAMNYLYEANLKLAAPAVGGVVAYRNGSDELLVTLNPQAGTWSYQIAGSPKVTQSLPANFAFSDPAVAGAPQNFHTLRVVRNGGTFDLFLDAFRLTGAAHLETGYTAAGLPGRYAESGSVEFGYAFQTIGWDEYDEHIRGWNADGGSWSVTANGLVQSSTNPASAFKGDLLDQYEFTVDAATPGMAAAQGGTFGIYPLHVDAGNFLKAMVDVQARTLTVAGKKAGADIGPWTANLGCWTTRNHTYATSDGTTNWVYDLRSESVISGLDVAWFEGLVPFQSKTFVVPSACTISYRSNGIWNPVSVKLTRSTRTGAVYYFSPVVADGFRIECAEGASSPVYPEEVRVYADAESAWFFRSVKLADRVVLALNGNDLLTIPGSWPAARPGLCTDGTACTFNGINAYHRPETPLTDPGFLAWRAGLFSQFEVGEGIASDVNDIDGDGFDNGSEFLAGTSPENASDFFQLYALPSSGFSFDSVAGHSYTVYGKTNLTSGSWEVFQQGISGTGAEISILNATNAPAGFFRVEVGLE